MNQMSQMSQESIKEADVIEESELQGLNASSQDTNQSEKKLKKDAGKVEPEISMVPWKALLQYQKRSQTRQSGTEKSSQKLSNEPQILKKIKIKPVFIAETERTYKSRKQLPEALQSSESQIEESAQSNCKPIEAIIINNSNSNRLLPAQNQKSNTITLSNLLPQQNSISSIISTSNSIPNSKILANLRKNRYRRKGYFFEDKMIKIKDLQLTKSTQAINVRGEIIFMWLKYNFNQKWANTEMICVELYDDSGTVLLAIPNKIAERRGWDLEIGKLIEVSKVQTRQKYPRKLCLLLTETSILKILPSSMLSHSNRFFPQQHSLSVMELQSCPIGQTISLICLVLQKSPIEYIRSHSKNVDLTLCKILVYDPIHNIYVWVKLWQQKTQIKFYFNALVYLLRGIEVKEFKGVREYHASKEFNYRQVSGTKIESYLENVYSSRNKLMEQVQTMKKETISVMNISIGDSMKKLQYQYIDARKSAELNQQIDKNSAMQIKQISKTEQSTLQNLPIPVDSPSHKGILSSCSLTTIKFIDIELRSCYRLSSLQCCSRQCRAHVTVPVGMESARGSILCPACKTLSSSSLTLPKYSIKCEVYDGCDNYLAEIGDEAGKKLFTIQTNEEPINQMDQKTRENNVNSAHTDGISEMKVEFLQCMSHRFRMMIGKDIIGDTVKAVILCTRQRIHSLHNKTQSDILNTSIKQGQGGSKNEAEAEECWVTGCYILDVYQDGSRIDSKEGMAMAMRRNDEDYEVSKNQSTRPMR